MFLFNPPLCALCPDEKKGGSIRVSDYTDAAKKGETAPSAGRYSELPSSSMKPERVSDPTLVHMID